MKRSREAKVQKKKGTCQAFTAEMMLVKTVLEEKNELLDQKDRIIQELRNRQRQLETELELKDELDQTTLREEALQEGIRLVVAEVVALASQYETGGQVLDKSLASRLIQLFQDRYDLEVIAGAPTRIDPECHRVIEVVPAPEAERCSSIRVLSRGFRIAGKTIKPALVKVIKGEAESKNTADTFLQAL